MDFFKYVECTTFAPLGGFRVSPYLRGCFEPLPPLRQFVVKGDVTLLTPASLEIPSTNNKNGTSIDRKVRKILVNYEDQTGIGNAFKDPKSRKRAPASRRNVKGTTSNAPRHPMHADERRVVKNV